ncbi:unnamed protein product, partial [Cyprideis torosa]
QPVIPLPELVEVRTGEEEEETLYSQRAKLYRRVDKEFKERGTGDIKIQLNTETNKIRLLMRREKVLKICLNHLLTPDIEFKPRSDEKSFVWAALDASEPGEPVLETFAVRFKSPEIAQEFLTAVKDAQSKVKPSPGRSSSGAMPKEPEPFSSVAKNLFPKASEGTASDEESIVVVFDRSEEATSDQRRRAEELKLPVAFCVDTDGGCPGCRGCREEMPVYAANPEDTKAPPAAAVPAATSSSSSSTAFLNGAENSLSFSSLASAGTSLAFASSEKPSWLPTKVTPLFRGLNQSGGAGGGDSGDEGEGGEHDPHYDPVIPLPDLVEVKTGEENEER